MGVLEFKKKSTLGLCFSKRKADCHMHAAWMYLELEAWVSTLLQMELKSLFEVVAENAAAHTF